MKNTDMITFRAAYHKLVADSVSKNGYVSFTSIQQLLNASKDASRKLTKKLRVQQQQHQKKEQHAHA